MDANTVLKQSGNAAYQVVEGEAIVIRLDTGNYYSLDRVGTDYWRLINGRDSIADQAVSIADTYNSSAATLVETLQSLARDGAYDGVLETLAADYDLEPELITKYLSDLSGVNPKRTPGRCAISSASI